MQVKSPEVLNLPFMSTHMPPLLFFPENAGSTFLHNAGTSTLNYKSHIPEDSKPTWVDCTVCNIPIHLTMYHSKFQLILSALHYYIFGWFKTHVYAY
jgi:hypothetical protein